MESLKMRVETVAAVVFEKSHGRESALVLYGACERLRVAFDRPGQFVTVSLADCA